MAVHNLQCTAKQPLASINVGQHQRPKEQFILPKSRKHVIEHSVLALADTNVNCTEPYNVASHSNNTAMETFDIEFTASVSSALGRNVDFGNAASPTPMLLDAATDAPFENHYDVNYCQSLNQSVILPPVSTHRQADAYCVDANIGNYHDADVLNILPQQ